MSILTMTSSTPCLWAGGFHCAPDIRKASPTFGNSIGFEWSAVDGVAVPVPAGVAHAVFFLDDSVLIREDPGYRERILEAAAVNEAMDRFRNERCCAGSCYDRSIGC